jgi:hypothetical protein
MRSMLRHRADHLVGEQLVVAGERGERRTQLVTHRRQEAPLRPVGCLRLLQEQRLVHRERRMIRQHAKPLDVAPAEREGADGTSDGEDAERIAVRSQRRDEHRAERQLWDHSLQRAARAGEVLLGHELAPLERLVQHRAGELEAASARDQHVP